MPGNAFSGQGRRRKVRVYVPIDISWVTDRLEVVSKPSMGPWTLRPTQRLISREVLKPLPSKNVSN